MNIKILPLVTLLFAYQVQADSLLQAIQSAGAANAELQVAMYQQLAGSEKSNQGLAGLGPTIQLDGAYNQQDQPGASYASKVTRHNAGISLSQPLFDLAKYADYLRGNALADSASIEFLKAQETLIYNVAESYANVLYQSEILRAAHAATQVYENQLRQATLALSLGDATRVDVDEIQANRDLYRAKEIEAENNLASAGTRYQRLTTLDYHNILNISSSCLLTKHGKGNESDIYRRALVRNINIRHAQSQWQVAQTEVYQANSAQMPTVSLQASYGTNWSRGEDNNELDELFGTTAKTDNTNIGIAVSVPIFSGGRQMSQSREAIYTREQARYMLIDTQQKTKEELHNTILSVVSGYSLVTSTQRVISSEQNKIRSTATGKKLGLRTQMDELNAYQSYYEAVKNNAEARYKLFIAKVALVRSTGDLGHDALKQIACLQ